MNLPFEFYKADQIRNPGYMKLPKIFRLYVLRNLVQEERKIQRRRVPEVNFYEQLMQLKLFIQEAESKGFRPLVDDFCLQRSIQAFFGDDFLWVRRKRGFRGGKLRKVALGWFRKHLTGKIHEIVEEEKQRNTALRCQILYMEKRILDGRNLPDDIKGVRKDLVKFLKPQKPATAATALSVESIDEYNIAHRQIIRDLLKDDESPNERSEEFDSMFLQEEGLVDDILVDFDESAYFGEVNDSKTQQLMKAIDDDLEDDTSV